MIHLVSTPDSRSLGCRLAPAAGLQRLPLDSEAAAEQTGDNPGRPEPIPRFRLGRARSRGLFRGQSGVLGVLGVRHVAEGERGVGGGSICRRARLSIWSCWTVRRPYGAHGEGLTGFEAIRGAYGSHRMRRIEDHMEGTWVHKKVYVHNTGSIYLRPQGPGLGQGGQSPLQLLESFYTYPMMLHGKK